MATRLLLAELATAFEQASGQAVQVESVGGVDAARRVKEGETFDAVVLASHAIDALVEAGRVVPGSRVDLVHSGVAIAVRAGAPRPPITSEDAVRRAVLAARSVGYSTGPSGVALLKLFEHWGITAQLQASLVQAPPGVPVGALVERGEVELGFQQLSELMALPGITVLGALPEAIQITTTFSGGVCALSAQADAARRWLSFMAAPAAASIKQRCGMQPA